MPVYFLDTSALAKRYNPEKGTPEIDRIFAEAGSRYLISRLTTVEIQSVFAAKVRTHEIDIGELRKLQKQFADDLSSHRLQAVKIFSSHFREAERLLKKHGPTKSFRTLDALQLSFALELARKSALDYFVSIDDRFSVIAALEGLSVINPEII